MLGESFRCRSVVISGHISIIIIGRVNIEINGFFTECINMIIGLAGQYCAGKNHVAAVLEKRGLPVLDADKLGYAVIENEKAAILARFGEGIRNQDGSVNRRLLGAKVFGNSKEMAALEAIVHPEVNRLTLEWVAAQNGKSCAINAAVLHKSAAFASMRCIILVRAPWITRLIRAKKRDRLPWAVLARRFASQKSFTAQYLAANADIYKIENPEIGKPGSLLNSAWARKKLERRVDEILLQAGLTGGVV